MKPAYWLAIGVAGCVLAGVYRAAPGPDRVSGPGAQAQDRSVAQAGASAYSSPTAPAVSAPALIGSSGRIIDLGGQTVAQYVARYASAARLGDPEAAYQVYLAESLCAVNPVQRDAGPDERNASPAPTDTARLCAGVTPAEVQERLRFLALAARTGRADAQIDFYLEGPNGTGAIPPAGTTPDDPELRRWKDDALNHLQAAAGQCDPLAAGLLATNYQSGQFNARDPAQAIAFNLLAAATGNGKWSRERLQARFGAHMTPEAFDAAYADGLRNARASCSQVNAR
jgi:TPR repeat protein